jgi:hypothetical protein
MRRYQFKNQPIHHRPNRLHEVKDERQARVAVGMQDPEGRIEASGVASNLSLSL